MIKINICSLFRDSEIWENRYIGQVSRFFRQIKDQRLLNELKINKVVCVYTESRDPTLECLVQEKNRGNLNIEIIEHNSNYGTVKSSASPERIKELSKCGCLALEAAKDDCDYIFWLESDIKVYDIFLLYQLYLTFSKLNNLGIVSPIITLDTLPTFFYDCFVFRDLSGTQWKNEWVWTAEYNKYERYVPMSSVGSCGLIDASLIKRGCNFGDGAFIELCRQIKTLGYQIICDKKLNIYHPSQILINGRWV